MISRYWDLNGTPAPQGLKDLWARYFLVDSGQRLLPSYQQFLDRWFVRDRSGFGHVPRPGAFEEIVGRVKDVTVSMRSEDWLTLPERVDNYIRIDLPDAVMKAYRKFARTMVLEHPEIEAVNSGVLAQKLLQLANGSVYDDQKKPIEIHDAKTDVLEEIIEGACGVPVLVGYSYQFDLVKIKRRFKHAVHIDDDKNFIDNWNAGKIQIGVLHPGSAGHGLNLQKGPGFILVWYGVTYNLEWYQQLNKRLHRSGQKSDRVIIHHIIARNTRDEEALEALNSKNATQASVINATILRVGQEVGYE